MMRRAILTISLAGSLAMASAAEPVAQQADTAGMAQRMKACAACHGKEGRSTNSGYFPRIAGKPVDYLYQQMLNFRDGRRGHAVMAQFFEFMSDDYLREIASYFAELRLPHPAPLPHPATPQTVARGERLVQQGDTALQLPACVQCHGKALTGQGPAIPGLLGLPRDYLMAQLGAWRIGQRRARAPDCMAQVAMRLSIDDITAVATWLARQPVPEDPVPPLTNPASLPLSCGAVSP